jgi:hypothetical protein
VAGAARPSSARFPAQGSCRLCYAGREPLPDPKCTPGAVDSAVTQANLKKTVCRKGGYTASVRPPESVSNAIKRRLLAAYGIPVADIGRYELDHLVELSDGGSSDVRNLWPENRRGLFNAGDKDRLEVYLRNQVCAGRMSLRAAQQAVATNWVKAYCDAKLGECPPGLR